MKRKVFGTPVNIVHSALALALLLASSAGALPVSGGKIGEALNAGYELAGERSGDTQYYHMKTILAEYSPSGDSESVDVYEMLLECRPGGGAGEEGFTYTCFEFRIELGDTAEISIPALEGWSYLFEPGIDESGQVFGIDHSRFEGLSDSEGDIVPMDKSYLIYNTFIDFHSFCDVFAEPSDEGAGIQDLERVGQRIVHSAAFSKPPVNLGSAILEGSYFQNGEITLEFKGLSAVDGRSCALIEYDSGESSYRMLMEPVPGMEIETVGRSHYTGDIYKDLETNWVQKVTMIEFVISETRLPMPPGNINSIVERNILIRNLGREEWRAILKDD